MRLSEITYGTAQAIDGYGPGFFRVGGHVLRGACIVTPWDAGPWGGITDWATPLTLVGRIDVLLVGMGAEIAQVPADFRAALEGAGIGVEVMNLSVNETLSRTLMTSITTLIAVGSMLVLGGDVIRGFSFAIFMGVILGTYSSVYVAKNLVLFLGLDRSDKAKKTGKGADHEFAKIDA